MLIYKQLNIFWFSGTGNAKMVAETMAEKSREMSIPVFLHNIDNFNEKKPEVPDQSVSCIISPTHGFNYPPIVLDFILKMPKGRGRSIFLMNTRAGTKLHKLFLPGASGIALLLAWLILRIKGYHIVGMRPVDPASNWISLHPGLRDKVVKSLMKRACHKAASFAGNMLEGKRKYPALRELPIDLALLPIAIGYYFIGRFMLAKTFMASWKCNNCGRCIRECPVKAISQPLKYPYWSYRCESCMRCMNHCPRRAIQTIHGFTVFAWWLLLGVAGPAIYLLVFDGLLPTTRSPEWISGSIDFFILSAISVPLLILSYRLLYLLMHIKPVNWVISVTSFTFYRFWRRYNAGKAAEADGFSV
ncbi:MAG: EFR1 family ferrodoxin [Bacteroidetes bacterium]|nr:EFR1 family ferrodoxin [Bacteroidota bacterium]MBU1720668.1 EFR1 family ferrodoxin [Bacteroidota bacterium]